MKLIILVTGFGLLAGMASAEDTGFERYRVIIQNAPFGDDKIVVTTKPPPPPPPKINWANDYRISMLRERNGEVAVGLVKTKTNESVFLKMNETHPVEGIKLVSADLEKSEIMLEKSGETRALTVESKDFLVTKTAPTKSKDSNKSKISSFKDRMEQRRKEMAKAKAKPQIPQLPRLSQEELQKHLQNYQVEAIKKGLPPLPVQITPAMEQQLINDGAINPR